MLRFLILAVIGYLVYRAVKNWLYPARITGARPTDGEIDEVMVQDPYCRAYFPKREGVHVQLEGRDLYFCSQTCKQNYIEDHPVEKE